MMNFSLTAELERLLGSGKENLLDKLKCKKCQKSFISAISLQKHMKLVHEVENQQGEKARYKCEYCRASYSNKRNLARHFTQKHKKIKRFNSNVCKPTPSHLCRSFMALQDSIVADF